MLFLTIFFKKNSDNQKKTNQNQPLNLLIYEKKSVIDFSTCISAFFM